MDAVERSDRDGALGRGKLVALGRRRSRDSSPNTVSGRAWPPRARDRDQPAVVGEPSAAVPRRGTRAAASGRAPTSASASSSSGRWGSASSDRQHAVLVGVVDPKRADGRPAERPAMAAERVGDRADVRPAPDVQLELDSGGSSRRTTRIAWTMRAPHRHLDGDAPPVQSVRALAVDLDRRRRRYRQLDLARSAAQRGLEIVRERRLLERPRPRRRPSSSGGRARPRSRSACRARRGSARAGSPARAARAGARSRAGRGSPRARP